jgi:large subunit ribosomal protein L7/L12
MGKITERITVLESRLKELKAQEQRANARRRVQQAHRERRDDTRRKILVGAFVLNQVERGEFPQERLRAALDRYLSRPDDRALFGLADRPNSDVNGEASRVPNVNEHPRK